MKYFKYLICFFVGMAVAFWVSFWIESMNPEPHEGALLFESFAWYSCVFLVGVVGLIASKVKVKVL
ncbi:hypothetical protein [Leptospira santarosai]|uniref:hypothetical protein n=1 Tax=Leptospira santarosai TaxID=28183 RepID=UPI0024AECFFB|nr:hypothetical protein [Leptospira santarosai]MDI7209082.1 hypothetical protein [Leptospira santarosai]MDI7220372.1 hypothetical protein [Leptospira santarosai]MDI7226220.1 hypothetical protein [Leptospira santarosai]